MLVGNTLVRIETMAYNCIASNIEHRIREVLDKTGMYYRIFSRVKKEPSIKKKLTAKQNEYSENGRKMQDYIGVRIVFYFKDDIDYFVPILRSWPSYDKQNESNSIIDLARLEDEIKRANVQKLQGLVPLVDKVFMPERLNLVMRMNEYETDLFNCQMESQTGYNSKLIDNTYEIQLRTVLSEGWHEVEHDLRYKTRKESWWNECQKESRLLNGIYAALVSNESHLTSIVDDIAYKAYLSKEWDTMIRFHFRRRTDEQKLSPQIASILDKHVDDIAKVILRFDRDAVVQALNKIRVQTSITTDLLTFIVNRSVVKDQDLLQLEPRPTTQILNQVFSNV